MESGEEEHEKVKKIEELITIERTFPKCLKRINPSGVLGLGQLAKKRGRKKNKGKTIAEESQEEEMSIGILLSPPIIAISVVVLFNYHELLQDQRPRRASSLLLLK